MIAISPKALRFAKMAFAEVSSNDKSYFATIIPQLPLGDHRSSSDVMISEHDARLYVRSIADVLKDTSRFEGGDLDGNDFEFFEIIKEALERQLTGKGSVYL